MIFVHNVKPLLIFAFYLTFTYFFTKISRMFYECTRRRPNHHPRHRLFTPFARCPCIIYVSNLI